ncbi:hypothetical protein V2J09_004823 [Rumex salicifolius]
MGKHRPPTLAGRQQLAGRHHLFWYSNMLLDHGDRILSSVTCVFKNTGTKISVKTLSLRHELPRARSNRRLLQHAPPRWVPSNRPHALPPQRHLQLHVHRDA